MFKKIKEYYQKFKEMRADSKLKPIISLVLWFIFIFIAILFVKGFSLDNNSNSNLENVRNNFTGYKFTYTNNNLKIFGESYDGKLEFFFEGNRYYYDEQNVYLVNNQSLEVIDNFDLNVLKITPDLIDSLISNLNYSIYNNALEYIVPLSRFLNLYEYDVEADLSLANNYNIMVYVYKKENDIYMYKLDLSNYYQFRGLNNMGILTIDIYDVEKGDFPKYYDSLIGGVK